MLSLKIKFQGDIRRVSVVDSTSFSELLALVAKLYGSALPVNYNIKYPDEDGDYITVSGNSDWAEATASGSNLVLVISESNTPLVASTTPSVAIPTAPVVAASTSDFSDFELLLTSQQQRQQDQAPTRDTDTLAFLSTTSASEQAPAPAAVVDSSAAVIVDAAGVNVDDLPIKDKLETLLVELVFSGEHVIDEVVAALTRASANVELTAIVKSLELFLAPARESLRTGGAKACGLFADLQEQAGQSMLIARIASVISLAVESVKRDTTDASPSTSPATAAHRACAAAATSFNVREQISNIVRGIETHPQVTLLIDTIKEKLAPLQANKTTPTAPAAEVVAAEFVADVTIPDDSELVQFETVTKTWRIRNSGNVSWPAGITLVGTTTTPIAQRPMPGTEIEISALLRPTAEGVNTEYYNVCDVNGNSLLRLWARYNCVAPPNPALNPEVLAQLCGLGFANDASAAALIAAEGDFNFALETLLSSTQL